MKLSKIIELLENNHNEIDVFDHIRASSQKTATDYHTFALYTFFSKEHTENATIYAGWNRT